MNNNLDKNIHYEVGDARTFESDKKFDVVCLMFHVINYQTINEQLDAFFKTSFNALKLEEFLIFGMGLECCPKNRHHELLRSKPNR